MTDPNGINYSHPGYPHVKRAEVYRGGEAWWMVVVWSGEIPERELPIRMRASTSAALRIISGGEFGTHAEALAYALHEVGLTPTTNPEPMEAS